MTTIKRVHERSVHDDEQHNPSSPSMAWMPLEGLTHQWATFAETFLGYAALTATAQAFSALSLEAKAVRQYNEACQACASGHTLCARDLYEEIIRDLHQASDRWMHALFELERVATDTCYPLDEQEHIVLRRFFAQTTDQLQRVGVLTQQVHAQCVRCYQQQGLPEYGEEG